MNYYIGLILLNVCISLSWADDFRLSVSKEIIEAADRPADDLDGLSLAIPEKPDESGTDSPRRENIRQPQASASENDAKSADVPESGLKSRSQLMSVRSKSHESVNNFLPIQTVQANQLLGRQTFAGTHLADTSGQVGGQNQMAIAPLDQFHDEIRLMLGEDIYAKMVWTYRDAKQLDNWIYATIDQSGLFAQDSLIVGLNDQLMASLTDLGFVGASDRNLSIDESSKSHSQQPNRVEDTEKIVNDALMKAEFKRNSAFFGLLKYLTLMNLLYLLSSIAILVYAVKLFKFLVRQQ